MGKIRYWVIFCLAKLRSSAAQNYIGYCYEEGMHCKKDMLLAERWYKFAADQNNAHGLANLGRFYEEKISSQGTIENAISLYEKAATQGHIWAQNRLGSILIQRNKGVDAQKAIYWLEKAAGANYAAAKLNLAWIFSKGISVAKDLEKAYLLTKEAALQGSAVAQYNLGLMLMKGDGIKKNEPEALEWLSKAKENGSLDAYKFLRELH